MRRLLYWEWSWDTRAKVRAIPRGILYSLSVHTFEGSRWVIDGEAQAPRANSRTIPRAQNSSWQRSSQTRNDHLGGWILYWGSSSNSRGKVRVILRVCCSLCLPRTRPRATGGSSMVRPPRVNSRAIQRAFPRVVEPTRGGREEPSKRVGVGDLRALFFFFFGFVPPFVISSCNFFYFFCSFFGVWPFLRRVNRPAPASQSCTQKGRSNQCDCGSPVGWVSSNDLWFFFKFSADTEKLFGFFFFFFFFLVSFLFLFSFFSLWNRSGWHGGGRKKKKVV